MNTDAQRCFMDKKYSTLRSSQKALLSTAYKLFKKKEYKTTLEMYFKILPSKNLTHEVYKEIKQQINIIMNALSQKDPQKTLPTTENLPELVNNIGYQEQSSQKKENTTQDTSFFETTDYSVNALKKSFEVFLKSQLIAKELASEESSFDESEVYDALNLENDFTPAPYNKNQISLDTILLDEHDSSHVYEEKISDTPDTRPYEDSLKLVEKEYPFQESLEKIKTLESLQSKVFKMDAAPFKQKKSKLLKQVLEYLQLPKFEEQVTDSSHSDLGKDLKKDFISLDEHVFQSLEDQAVQKLHDQGKLQRFPMPNPEPINKGFFLNTHSVKNDVAKALENSFETLDPSSLKEFTTLPPDDHSENNADKSHSQQEKNVTLTYNFKNLFRSHFYKKYRSMLNEAASLVAQKELDDALEMYYVVKSQNIPPSFKKMIQKNIEDIESAITKAFHLSNTIVQVDDGGKIHNPQNNED